MTLLLTAVCYGMRGPEYFGDTMIFDGNDRLG